MSMYPSPYLPPGVQQYYSAPVDPLRHAKRASLLMFIIGPLILLGGTCMLSVPAIIRMAPPGAETDQMLQTIHEETHGHIELFSEGGAVAIVLGLGIVILGFFVRRGGSRSCTIGAAVMGLLAAWFLLNLLGCVVMGNIAGVFLSLILVGLFSATVIWLIQAIRASATIHLAQQQYAAQYWQYQQTMQAYANGGYGYGAAPSPPPAPPAQEPPQDPNGN